MKLPAQHAANDDVLLTPERTARVAAANDDVLLTPERTARVAAAIDDPCDEGGFDQFCRDRNGRLCQFHQKYCFAPDYPCIDRLRHFIAVSFLEDIARRRAKDRGQA